MPNPGARRSILSSDNDGNRVWTVTTTVVCKADRHDTISAYKNHHCRCPAATIKAVGYERRRGYGGILPTQPADLTMRRLQALAVTGWPCDVIGDMAGRNRVSISEIRRGECASVTGRTEAAVHGIYRRLHTQTGPSGRTRAYAARQGWRGPSLLLLHGAVDEVAVARAVRGEAVDLQRNERLTAVQILHVAGRSYGEIARRIGKAERQVYRDLCDLGLIIPAEKTATA